MFSNIGGKIKTFVVVCFIFGCIGALFTAISFWTQIDKGGAWMFFIGLLAGGGVFLISWIGSFVLYGYGQIVENTDSITYYLEDIARETKKQTELLANEKGDPDTKADTKYTSNNSGMSNFRRSALGYGTSGNNGVWRCKNCGEDNAATSMFCASCGEQRIK